MSSSCSGIVSSFVSTVKHPHVGLAFLLFIPLAIVVSTIWSSVNWFLSIAAVFVVRDSEDTFGSIATAVDFCRRSAGKVAGAGFWFGAMHLVAFVMATTVVMYPLSLATLVPAGVTLGLMGLVTLAYFAVADYLHIARLAGYVSLVEWDRSPKPAAEIVAPIFVSEPPTTVPPPGIGGSPTLEAVATPEDEPLFALRPAGPSDRDLDEPLMPGFSPGEPLPGR